jgi:lactoylglutathione lyase
VTDTDFTKELMLKALGVMTGELSGDAALELFAPDYVDHGGGPGPKGRDRVLLMGQALRRAFPDLSYEVTDLVAENDLVVLHMTLKGTHEGLFMAAPVPPTHQVITINMVHIVRVADGRLAEHWAYRDDLSMLTQLGALPRLGAS